VLASEVQAQLRVRRKALLAWKACSMPWREICSLAVGLAPFWWAEQHEGEQTILDLFAHPKRAVVAGWLQFYAETVRGVWAWGADLAALAEWK
jgi:hypothetical protein